MMVNSLDRFFLAASKELLKANYRFSLIIVSTDNAFGIICIMISCFHICRYFRHDFTILYTLPLNVYFIL